MSRAAGTRKPFPHVEAVSQILTEKYRDNAHGNKSNPLRELLFIICSVQTNETLYQSTYTSLIARFPTFRQLSHATEEEIAAAIEHGGLSRQKARTIKAILRRMESDFGSPTLSPLRRMNDTACEAYLESLPGVGKKTARCVMLLSLQRSMFPVDSNCWRICRRLGWVRHTRPDKSCSPRDMDRVQAGIPASRRLALHVNFVSHGRACCLPGEPCCDSCCVREYCRTGQRT